MTKAEADTLRAGDHLFAMYNVASIEMGPYRSYDLRIERVTLISRHGSETKIQNIHEKDYRICNEYLHIERESATQMIEGILERLVSELKKNHEGEMKSLDTFVEEVREDIYRSARERLAGEQS